MWNLSPRHIFGRQIRKWHLFYTKNIFRPKSWRHLGLRGKKGLKIRTWQLNTLKMWSLSPSHIFGREIRKWHPFYTKHIFRPKWWRHLGLRGKKGLNIRNWQPNMDNPSTRLKARMTYICIDNSIFSSLIFSIFMELVRDPTAGIAAHTILAYSYGLFFTKFRKNRDKIVKIFQA